MVKTIIEESTAVSLLSTDLTLAWQLSQVPHTRQATFAQVLTSMASLPASFASVTVPTGSLVPGPTTAAFNTLSATVSSTSTSMSTAQTQITDLENRVGVLESGGTKTGITIASIIDQNTGTPFTVSGTLIGYPSAPTLQYRDNAGTFGSFPGGSTVTATAYSFTHPSVGAATAAMTVTVRDQNTTTVSATSNSFAVISGAAGAPDPPTGLAFIANSGSSITVGFAAAATGAAIDAGGYYLQYKRASATNWIAGPTVPVVTNGVGRFVDPAGSIWQITGGVITQTIASGTTSDSTTNNVTQLLLIRNVVWQLGNGNWYWSPYTSFPGSWTGPITTSPITSPGVRVPEDGVGLAVNTSYNIRVAASNAAGVGLNSAAITASTAVTDTFTTG